MLLLILPVTMSGCWVMDFNARMANKLVPSTDMNREVIIEEAQSLLMQKKKMYSEAEWAKGPCLGKVNDQWVVDIAHNPRKEVDDHPNNQCTDFLEGKVKHFVELTPEGNLIKTF